MSSKVVFYFHKDWLKAMSQGYHVHKYIFVLVRAQVCYFETYTMLGKLVNSII